MMDINIKAIRNQIEKNDSFQHWKKEVGLSFEDFDLIDLNTNKTISHGKKDIGYYWIYLKAGKIYSIGYDMRVA